MSEQQTSTVFHGTDLSKNDNTIALRLIKREAVLGNFQ
jgi:hypothetical protein